MMRRSLFHKATHKWSLTIVTGGEEINITGYDASSLWACFFGGLVVGSSVAVVVLI